MICWFASGQPSAARRERTAMIARDVAAHDAQRAAAAAAVAAARGDGPAADAGADGAASTSIELKPTSPACKLTLRVGAPPDEVFDEVIVMRDEKLPPRGIIEAIAPKGPPPPSIYATIESDEDDEEDEPLEVPEAEDAAAALLALCNN